MKKYDVTAAHPRTGQEWNFRMVDADRLIHNEHGETMYKYNSKVQWEVVAVEVVPQSKVDATRRYFEKYGTKGE